MQLHTLETDPGAKRARKRLGRGRASGTGKTSGHGHKGQMARKGHKHKRGFEGGQMPLIRRIPKRGFNNINDKDFIPVNVSALEAFADGAEVTPASLRKAGLAKGPGDGIKILGQGALTRRLTVQACAFSESARLKIEAAGGTCEVVRH